MDLAVTSYLLLFCAIVLFRLGKRYGSEYPRRGRILLATGILLASLIAWGSGGSLRWAVYFPHSFVLLVSNAFVILVVGSAGLLVGTRCMQRRGERLATSALCLTAVWFLSFALVRPVFQPLALDDAPMWEGRFCLQSHESTCAPAAAATLLRLNGIWQSEKDMARACLTSEQGTLPLGTFHGLCVASRQSRVSPRAMVCDPESPTASDLEQRLPMLAHVDFDKRLSGQTRWSGFERMGAFGRSDGHAVVILERKGESWLVADPAVGTVCWSDAYLRRIWLGEGIFLVPRD